MQNLSLFTSTEGKLFPSILLLGAHCDDIEIGCGGAILRLAEEKPNAAIRWVVFSGSDLRRQEALRSASDFLTGFKKPEVEVLDFPNMFFPDEHRNIKLAFEKIKQEFNPDIIFTHHKFDLHQDHRTLGEITWNTFRDNLIFEYEIPKYDGGLGNPNAFFPLSSSLAQRKIDIIVKHFESQQSKTWFSGELFYSLMRLRGLESASKYGLSEAFHCRKAQLSW